MAGGDKPKEKAFSHDEFDFLDQFCVSESDASQPTNATTWTVGTPYVDTFRSIGYGGSLFVAGGSDGYVATSPTGTAWTQRTTGWTSSQHIWGVGYGGGTFVIVGANGKLATSTDAITWTDRTSGLAGTVIRGGVAFGSNTWVIAGDSGVLSTSSNATSWTARTSTFGASGIQAVAYGAGTFIAVGEDGKISTSGDQLINVLFTPITYTAKP